MKSYLVQLTMRQPISLPSSFDLTTSLFSSDTLWGILCWAIRNLEGQAWLVDMLEWYAIPEKPSLVSSVFLCRAGAPLVPYLADPAGRWLNVKTYGLEDPTKFYTVEPLRAVVSDRATQSTVPYDTKRVLVSPSGATLCFWLSVLEDYENVVLGALRYFAEAGSLGGRSASGYGSIKSLTVEPYQLPEPTQRFITLSATAAETFEIGQWQVRENKERAFGGFVYGTSLQKPPTTVWAEGTIFEAPSPAEVELLGLIDVTPQTAAHSVYRMCYPFPLYLKV